MKIESGTGNGSWAGVDDGHRILTRAENYPYQHVISDKEEQAYQALGTATLASGSVCALHLRNTSTDRNIVVTYIRHQIIDPTGGTTIPNAANYFSLTTGRTYVSGGASVTPVNVHLGSPNAADVTAHDSNPTMTGSSQEIDRWYTKAEADMNSFNKEGALIINPGQGLECCYVGDKTSGLLYTRVSFLMELIS